MKKKITKKDWKEHRAWALLIPRIEGILTKEKICSEYKCVLISYVIEQERNREED